MATGQSLVYVCMRTEEFDGCVRGYSYAHGGKTMGGYVCMCIRTESNDWSVCVYVYFSKKPRLKKKKPVLDKFPNLWRVLWEAQNGPFGFSLELILRLGRPWAVLRPETMCFVLLAPGGPEPCVLLVFGPWGRHQFLERF